MANEFILRTPDYLFHKSITLVLIAVLASCSTISNTKPGKICTAEFRMVSVQFKDNNGRNVAVNNFRSVNKRTNSELIKSNSQGLPGYYTIASDADLHSLSLKGDTIQISANRPGTGETISGLFVISGGKDACHVEKLSGPEIITIN